MGPWSHKAGTDNGLGRRRLNGTFGSWSCENALAEALTPRHFGAVVILPSLLSGSAPDAGFKPFWAALRQVRAHICDDYALIAARSGGIPMIFMTRVRL